jgi:integrase
MLAEGRDVTRGTVFVDSAGGYLRKSNFARGPWRRVLERTGLGSYNFDGLRHTCASLLLAAGVPLKVVSERLGHGSPAFTASVYQHVAEGLQEKAAAQLQTLLTPPEAPAAG